MSQTTPAEEKVSVDEKRAQWEQFRFVVLPNGYVNVKNESHGDEPGHIYSVNPEAGRCSCKHQQYRQPEGGCKHIRAVRGAPLINSSARAAGSTATKQVATDGGHDPLPEITHHTEPAEVGGKRYARCEGCGSESIHGATRILHESGCALR